MPASVLADPPQPPVSSSAPWTDDYILTIPASAHTFDGFREWAETLPEKARVTFFAGEVIVDMSNEDFDLHVAVKTEICYAICRLNKETGFGRDYSDGGRLSNPSAEVSNNPDAIALLRGTIKSGRCRVVKKDGKSLEMVGTPDWVLEVVSPGSVKKDTKTLRKAYHAAGIPEYWLVDARGSEIDFTILKRADSEYGAAPIVDGWQESQVFGRRFRLSRKLDEDGLYEYSLESALI